MPRSKCAESMKSFRVIDTGIRGGRANIAFDQAIIDARKERRIPDTIRFLRFRPSALVGLHQILNHEVRVDYCRSRGIEIGRRITGGGGLYLDEGQIGWELVFDRDSFGFSNLGDVTHHVCESAALGLNKLGVPARYRPRNDIEVDGRKISGTGGFVDGSTIFYQGTLLIDFDPEDMIAALKVPVEKLAKRDLASARQRIVTMREVLGAKLPDLPTIYRGLLEGFAEGLGIAPAWGDITPFEEELAERHYREEIGTDEFVALLDAPEIDDTLVSASLTRRGGSLRADIRLEGPARGRIREALITGDFFVTPPRVLFDLEAALRGIDIAAAARVIDGFFSRTSAEFLSLGPGDIRDVVDAALRQLTIVADGRRLRGHRIDPTREGLPTLVFLHDALGCTRLWRDFPHRLAAATGCGALIYDRWGSGDSEPLQPPFSRQYLIDEALRALPEVLRTARIDRPVLIGHSDGATIALAYAGAFPQSIRGVIAIAPHLFREEHTLATIWRQIEDFERGDLKARLARYHGAKTESLFRRLVEVWTADRSCAWHVEPLLRQISCPVLVIQGTEDEFFSVAQVDAISAHLPQRAEAFFVPGCGHAPHLQEPKLVHAAVAGFLERLLPCARPRALGPAKSAMDA